MDDPVTETAYYLVVRRGGMEDVVLVQGGHREPAGIVQVVRRHWRQWRGERRLSDEAEARRSAARTLSQPIAREDAQEYPETQRHAMA